MQNAKIEVLLGIKVHPRSSVRLPFDRTHNFLSDFNRNYMYTSILYHFCRYSELFVKSRPILRKSPNFRPNKSTQPCIPLGSLNRVPALIGWGKGGNVTSAGWQVILCDPIWHVSSPSSVVLVAYASLPYLTLPHQHLAPTLPHSSFADIFCNVKLESRTIIWHCLHDSRFSCLDTISCVA